MPKGRSKNISLGKTKAAKRKDISQGQDNLNRRAELGARIREKLTKKAPEPEADE